MVRGRRRAFAPADRALMAYAASLLRQGRAPEGLEAIEDLVERLPDDPALERLRAAALLGSGDYQAALAAYEALLARAPGEALAWLAYGRALAAVGRGGAAAEAMRRGLVVRPDLCEAYWSLANLKTGAFTPAETRAMVALRRRRRLSDVDKVHLDFALGKMAEDAGDTVSAFAAYARANTLHRASLRYDPGRVSDHVSRSRNVFTTAFFEARPGQSDDGTPSLGQEVIFIVGLPRAGSTLVEQILASHSQVEAAGELPDIALLARRSGLEGAVRRAPPGAAGYPERLADMSAEDMRSLGEAYLAGARPYRRLGRPFFIDKAPNNFFHLGLISLALPAARIVDARRGAMACCVSCFRQHFAAGQAFTYDLAELGQYYANYVALMDHFDAALPRGVVRVRYENLVREPEPEIVRLLEALHLPFEPACLAFHQGTRAVRTPSTLQVRRPMTTEGLDAWRRFEPWLGPLRAALGPLADDPDQLVRRTL